MATINPTVTTSNVGFGQRVEVAWVGGTDADTLTPHQWMGRGREATYQVYGTLGSPAATVNLEASNDGAAYGSVLDVDGASVSGTAATVKNIRRTGKSVRPAISGGTGESVSVSLVYFL